MINDVQEGQIAAARGRTLQDKQVPLLINRDDFRLLPNVPLIRAKKEYMPYEGKADDDEATRRAYVAGAGHRRPRVVNSAAEADAFDIGKATKDELITFAFAEYGKMLNAEKDVRTLRKEFMEYVTAIDKESLS